MEERGVGPARRSIELIVSRTKSANRFVGWRLSSLPAPFCRASGSLEGGRMPRMKANASKLEHLSARLERLEDQLEIVATIGRYGIAADCTNWEAITEIWPEDGSYEVADWADFVGHDGLKQLFGGEFHQGLMQSGSAHLASVPVVAVEGNTASATNHGMVLRPGEGAFSIVRLTATRWDMEKHDGRWVAKVRRNEPLTGNDAARNLLARGASKPG
jgi:hypothetical protein